MKYLVFILPIFAFAQTHQLEKIVIGSKRGLSEKSYAGAVETISDFHTAGNHQALDLLEQVPGVSINQSGAPGQQAFIHIRGSEARHVLVLIDGVRVNDPSSVDKSFNSALLNVGDIEKIEVLKGSQTLLYGSEAMGGVVNIVTKKASAKNFFSAHAGFSQGANIDHTLLGDRSILHVHLFHDKSVGISAAAGGSEKDGFESKGATLNYSRQLGERWEGEWTYKVMDQFVETDSLDANSRPVDAQDDYSKSIQQIFSQNLKHSNFSYQLGMNKVNRFNKAAGEINGFNAFEYSNELQWRQEIRNGSLVLGLENLSETFSQSSVDEKFAGLNSLVVIRDFEKGEWFAQYGARASYHTQFEEAFSPSIGFGRFFGKHRVSLNYQQGFKSPTLYQLFGPDFGAFQVGNSELDPETNEYVDLNYQLGELLEVSLFYNRIEDFIEYDSQNGYQNAIFMESHGIEASSVIKNGNTTFYPGIYLANYHLPDDREISRRPSEKATMGIERNWGSHSLRLDWIWSGKRFDRVGEEEISLSSFDVWDVHYQLQSKNILWSAGVENLFGENYSQAYGYSSQPFTLYGKVKVLY